MASRAWRVEASTGGAGSQETPDTDKYPTPHPPHPRRVRAPALCSAATRTHAADTRHAAPARRVSSTPMLCGAHVPALARARRGEEPGNFTKFYEITSGTNSINWSSGYTMKIMKIMKWSCLNYIGCGPSSAKQRATAAQRNDLKCG